MMAALWAAKDGHEVTLLEKNEKLGKKLFITGKGRCNLTNDCDTVEFFDSVIKNKKFLYSAVYSFDHNMVKDFFEGLGVLLKTERGQRVFPLSDHSSDIISALKRALLEEGVNIMLNTKALGIKTENEKVLGADTLNKGFIDADCVIIATGGLSYPSTGSTGDGIKWAFESGHETVLTRPSLVPMVSDDEDIRALMGLSLKNVELSFFDGSKNLYSSFGEMIFTHFGISGPLVLSASAYLGDIISKKTITAKIDLKPALEKDKLNQRILRDFENNKNKDFQNAISGLFPSKLIPVIIKKSGIMPHKMHKGVYFWHIGA